MVTSFRLPLQSWAIAPAAVTGWGGPCHHVRRKFHDVFEATKSPIAEQALQRIGELYRIEAEITGQPAAMRLAVRQNRALPLLDALRDWLTGRASLGTRASQPWPRCPADPAAIRPTLRQD